MTPSGASLRGASTDTNRNTVQWEPKSGMDGVYTWFFTMICTGAGTVPDGKVVVRPRNTSTSLSQKLRFIVVDSVDSAANDGKPIKPQKQLVKARRMADN
ncbi:hypothetical protein H072_922 [Dactylellina haptotyla CBS 200.50]|uniref:Uncharacterized protein n=1 Tax=Dactylellina haptotyla (strain CBS 200.50) TaxID=1284197 RepID=S8AQ45_DACHA|nr:hypothetical protein H072_922 [Dactylellina haptotyla CBS 200.50]